MRILFCFILLLFLISCQTSSFKKDTEVFKINFLNKDANYLLNSIKDKKCSNIVDVDFFLTNYNVNDISGFDENLLHIASEYCPDNLFETILSQTININQPTVFSKTPLAIALDIKSINKAEKLLKRGADVNTLEFLSNPLFFIPIKQNNIKTLELLIEYNFDPYLLGFMNQSWKDLNPSIEIKKIMENYQVIYNQKILLKNKEKRNFLKNIINAD